MVRETVDHRKAKVGVGPAEKSFGLIWKDFFGRTHILNGLQSRVGDCYHIVVALPGVDVAFVVGLGDRLPGIVLLDENGGVVVGLVVELAVVGSILEIADIRP